MSTSSPSNPLQRAHALSLQASTILRPSLVPIKELNQALIFYQEAINLYEKAQHEAEEKENDEANTLKMLVMQHRKLLREVERRITNAQKDHSDVPNPTRVVENRPLQRRLVSESAASSRNAPGTYTAAGIQPSGLVNRLSPPHSIPPFAFRPNTVPVNNPNPTSEPSLSPLYSSSSTSSSTEESFIHFGSPPETLDPFSRFWGMVENMIEEVSGPVMFATAPVDLLHSDPKKNSDAQLSRERLSTKVKDKKKETTGEDSFYVVKNRNKGKGKEIESTDEEEEIVPKPSASASGPSKTAEELSLENASLKTSLDALAIHAESVDQTNKALNMKLEEREKGLKIIMEGLKKEAGRVKAGQEVWKSQILANSLMSSTNPGRIPSGSSGKDDACKAIVISHDNILGLADLNYIEYAAKKRIKELEDEVKSLKGENQKQKEQIGRYKERFEKIKMNAKAKKEAKLAAGQSDGNV
uniref:MIT domain-containing protein n=1 Tax=Kwoniella pini CBS 10737 TaxID=1296096 RepID=A0A1B9ICJ9_9TREE|nr:uncharacterized protein I206_00422 [Kwoniella pini CBS 10737]OCF53121.1 hypothetical protein I206_00422 [Kwoniella pini CBS 10737]